MIETVNLSMNSKGALSYIPSIWERRFPCPGTDAFSVSCYRSSRHGVESGCGWADLDAGVPERDARVQIRTERQARVGQDVRFHNPLFPLPP